MAVKSRRKGREAALRALYQLDIIQGTSSTPSILKQVLEELELNDDQAQFAERVVNGVRGPERREIDRKLSMIITEYDFERVAAVDRNVLRIAAYEILHEPAIPPAVTINEAIEIAKKYSTAESGRFVNGILGKLVSESPKANWDRATAPEEIEETSTEPEPEMEVVEETIEAESEEAQKLAKTFGWKLRSEDPAE